MARSLSRKQNFDETSQRDSAFSARNFTQSGPTVTRCFKRLPGSGRIPSPPRRDTRGRTDRSRPEPRNATGTTMTITDTSPPTSRGERPAGHPAGHEPIPAMRVAGPLRARYDEILTPDAIAFLTELHNRFARRRHDRLADRLRRRFEIGNGHDPQFRDDTRHIREDRRVAGRGRRSRARRPARRDHGPHRPQDDDQRAELGRQGLARRPGGRDEPDVAERHRGAAVAARRDPRASSRFTSPEGKRYAVTAEHTPTIVMRPRGWHLTEAHLRFTDRTGRGARGIRIARRLRAVLLPQRHAADRERPRPVLLHRQARVERGGEAVGRRLHASARSTSASRTARSARPCSSRRCRRRSRWRRSCSSCATTARA